MALVGHWPLDGNTNDYSRNQNHASSSSVVFSDGKIGQARSTGYATVTSNPAFNVKGEISIAFWFKPILSGARRVVMQTAYAGSFCINHETNGALRFYSGNNSSYQSLDSSVLTNGEWYHCVISRDSSGNRKWYLNGEQDTSGVTAYDGGTREDDLILGYGYTGNEASGLLNDVRIYNNVLSNNEIKKISQAKVYHYKMDRPWEESTTNLVPSQVGLSPDSFTHLDDATQQFVIQVPAGNATSWRGAIFNSSPQIVEKASSIMVFSYEALSKDVVPMSVDVNNYGITTSTGSNDNTQWRTYYMGSTIPNVWTKMYVIYQVNADQDYYSRHKPCIANGHVPATDIEVRLRNFQIEEKDHLTPFVEGTRSGTIVKDSSGFQNHAYHHADYSPEWGGDSIVGRGTNHYYLQRTLYESNHGIKDELTLACWVYLDEVRESGFIQSDFYLSCSSDGSLRTYWYNTSNAGYHYSSANLAANRWYHVAATWSGTEVKLYIDGKQDGSTVLSNTPGRDTSGYIAMGTEGNGWPPSSSRQLHGKMDDVRIYATALSADDMLALYNENSSSIKANSALSGKITFNATTNKIKLANN